MMKNIIAMLVFGAATLLAQSGRTTFVYSNYSSSAEIRRGPLADFFKIMAPEVTVYITAPAGAARDGVAYRVTVSYQAPGGIIQTTRVCEASGSSVAVIPMAG